MTTDLPDAAKPDHLTDALRRHGVLSAGRVRDVTTDAPRDTLVSRIVRLKLAYEGPAEKAPASLILKMWRARDGVPEAWAAREVLFYDTVAPATLPGPLLRCFDAGQSPQTKAWHLLLEDVTDSHRIATEWPLPPTEPQCRAIDEEGADWREVARIVLKVDPVKEPERSADGRCRARLCCGS
ncbi:MAG: hypothetical protein JOZ17_06125 [Acetobacteraceae bacterium]|nr:hypothetical protein [Acetobacteraceae bacterium]